MAGGGIWHGQGPSKAETVLLRGVQYVASSGRVLAVRSLHLTSLAAPELLVLSQHLAIVVSQSSRSLGLSVGDCEGACQTTVQVVAPLAAYTALITKCNFRRAYPCRFMLVAQG